jgi:WD40 repeat protein
VANDVTAALKRVGFDEVFLDFDKDTGGGAGADWEKTLYAKLSRCHALVLVLTPNWLSSAWCRIELAQARALGKTILPVICAPLGDRYVVPEFQAVDMLDWNSGGPARLEQRLRAIANELARGFLFDPRRSPYPGIQAFEAEDAAIYFGRDEETRAVIERLDGRRTQGGAPILVVIGASGCGKSSLLKAGVLPQLSRRHRDWVVLPPIRPEKAPLEMLAKAIAQQLGKPAQWHIWHQTLSSDAAIDHIRELLNEVRVGDARAATMLLPVDQFEEVFTVATAAERTTFLHLIASALDPRRDLPLMVIATGRSGVLEALFESGDFAHLTETCSLPPIPRDRLSQLIEGPATAAGLSVEKGLSEAIASDAESSYSLPQLAYTLWLLHRRSRQNKLSLAEYRSLGDAERGLNPIQNSVRLVADLALGGLRPTDAELVMRDAFVPNLVRVRLHDGSRARRSARLSDLPQDSLELIRALVEARLLSRRGPGARQLAADGSDTLVEASHEALFKAWPTLDRWLTEEHAFLSDIERIKSAYAIWVQASEDQKPGALLDGLLLSRASDWLQKYPQRFVSRDMAPLRAFITAGAEAEDTEKAYHAVQEARNRRTERRKFQAATAAAFVLFCASIFSGWKYFAAKQAEFAAERARGEAVTEHARGEAQRLRALAGAVTEERLHGNLDSALRLGVHAARLVPLQRNAVADSPARAALAAAVSQSSRPISLIGHEDSVWSAAFSPDGSRIVSASRDKTARVWDVATAKQIAVLRGHGDSVGSAAFSPDGSRIVTASSDNTARIWDAATGKEIAVLRGQVWQVCAAFSPDGSRIVTESSDNTARIWDASTAKEIAVLRGHMWQRCVAFSPDGSRIVTASSDNTARIWDAATTNEIAVLRGHEGIVKSAAFSPDGARIVTASDDKTARVWDATTGAEIVVLRGHGDPVNFAAFGPDGTRIVTTSSDKTGRIWDAATAKEIAVLLGHESAVKSAVFSPDGAQILTVSDDNAGRVWDAATGNEIAVLRGHQDRVNSAAYSPDGVRIVTASSDKTTRIWAARFATVTTEDLLVEVCTRRLRGITKLSRDEMRLAGYDDETPEIDVCAGIN